MRSLGELTASALLLYAPPPRMFNAPPQGALVRSLTQYLEERCALAPTLPTATERRVADCRRYLDRVRGLCAGTIKMHAAPAQVESPRIYRGERLPRALVWETVRTFLSSIDRTTSKGRRDYAMFVLGATHGLRAREVRALDLDAGATTSQNLRRAGASDPSMRRVGPSARRGPLSLSVSTHRFFWRAQKLGI